MKAASILRASAIFIGFMIFYVSCILQDGISWYEPLVAILIVAGFLLMLIAGTVLLACVVDPENVIYAFKHIKYSLINKFKK